MDTGRGMFCRGPLGPDTYLNATSYSTGDLPLTANIVQEDVLLRFLATLKSKSIDRDVIVGIRSTSDPGPVLVVKRFSQPTIFSTSTDTPIAISNNAWGSFNSDHLSGRYLLDNGLTR